MPHRNGYSYCVAKGANLEELVRSGRDRAVRLVSGVEARSAQRAFGGWLTDVRADQHGLLLDPDHDVDSDLMGVRLPRATGNALPAGRGYPVRRGALDLAQIAS